MAAFAPALTGSQSSDGFTATFEDSSIYGSNTEGYQPTDFARSIVLTDAFGNTLATLPLPGTQLTATYALIKDLWISAQLILIGHGNYQVTEIFPFDRITKNAYRNLLQQGCCPNKKIDYRLDAADKYLLGAAIEAPTGQGAGFQTDIDSAYAYLTAPAYS